MNVGLLLGVTVNNFDHVSSQTVQNFDGRVQNFTVLSLFNALWMRRERRSERKEEEPKIAEPEGESRSFKRPERSPLAKERIAEERERRLER